jgi:hypothetical protein
MISCEKITRFILLRSRGDSFDSIVKDIGVSKPTLIKWSRKYAKEIEEYESVYISELLECHNLSVKKQMELFRKRLDTIHSRLDEMAMGNMGTTELINTELKYLKAWNNIYSSYASRKIARNKEKEKQAKDDDMENEMKEQNQGQERTEEKIRTVNKLIETVR